MPKIDEMQFRPLGDFGVEVATDGDHIHVRIPRQSQGRPSSSGKMRLIGSSGGWQTIPDTDVRLSVMAGKRLSAG